MRGVSRFFGGLAALTDVSFSVEKGEILGLIGPNGAGKTTMFNVVNGFYPPSRGEVLFKGQRISGLKPHQICQRGLARTFQVVKPLQRMSTLDNVVASAFLRSKSKAEAVAKAEEILKFTSLWEVRDFGALLILVASCPAPTAWSATSAGVRRLFAGKKRVMTALLEVRGVSRCFGRAGRPDRRRPLRGRKGGDPPGSSGRTAPARRRCINVVNGFYPPVARARSCPRGSGSSASSRTRSASAGWRAPSRSSSRCSA